VRLAVCNSPSHGRQTARRIFILFSNLKTRKKLLYLKNFSYLCAVKILQNGKLLKIKT